MKFFLKKYSSLFVGLAIGLALFHSQSFLFAQDINFSPAAVPEMSSVSQTDARCIAQLSSFIDQERPKFLSFLQTHFQNTLANSNLTDVALQRYRQYRTMLTQKFYDLALVSPGSYSQPSTQPSTQIERLSELNKCQKRMQTEFSIAEQALRSHVRGTTSAKRTTAFVEKLQSVNGKLEDMNRQIGELRGYFQIMANKVPFFTPSCLKSP